MYLCNTGNLESIKEKTDKFEYKKLKCKNKLEKVFATFFTDK